MSESSEASTDVLQTPQFQEFIEDRDIREEDFDMIRELAWLPKSIFMENHNSFSGSVKFESGGIGKQFRLRAEHASDEQHKLYYTLMAEIADKYDGTAAWNLNIVFERLRE